MTDKKNRVYELAISVIHNRLTIAEFSELVNKSYRQSQRIISNLEKNGLKGLVHGNTGRAPKNKLSTCLTKSVEELLRTKYRDFNVLHFQEKLKENEGIIVSNATCYRIAKRNGLVKRSHYRIRKKVHKPRPRAACEGMMVQFDGSEHLWLPGITCDLIGGIDDATNIVLGAEFFIGETTLHSMKVMHDIVSDYGVPESFYLDQAGLYGKTYRDKDSTQIGRALDELNCTLLLATSAQAKGRIERLWNTFQDRLIAELKFNEIKTIPAANKFLKEVFIPDYNKKFSVQPRNSETKFRAIPSNASLKKIFSVVKERKITNGNIFSDQNNKFLVISDSNLKGRTIHITTNLKEEINYYIHGNKVEIKKI